MYPPATHPWIVAGTCLVLGVVSDLAAQSTQRTTWDFTGYMQGLIGVQDLGYKPPIGTEQRTAFSSQVIRLKWSLDVSDRIRISLHNRLQVQTSTTPLTQSGVVGLGVSARSAQSVNFQSVLFDEERFRVWHDLDRISVTVLLDAVDITVGRQAVTWGISNIFPVADLWAQFSPFELDIEEKPGIGAIRALTYPAEGVELDAVLADRGSVEDLSAGLRATVEFPVGDVYAGAGKFWQEFIAMGGVAFVLDVWKLRAEAALPWDLDRDELQSPRVTLGADWISSDLMLTFEYHHNGLGTNDPTQYVTRSLRPEFARGESYFLGRHYLGASALYQATDRLSFILAALINAGDPSAAITPGVVYDFGQFTRLSASVLWSQGSTPTFTGGIPNLPSEFGAYGNFGYARFSLYF